MIKNFKKFSDDFQKAINEIDRKKREIEEEENKVETKYKKDMVSAIASMLDLLMDKYGFESFSTFLREGRSDNVGFIVKMAKEISYMGFEFYGTYYSFDDIEKVGDEYVINVYEDEDFSREFSFMEMDILPLYKFFKILFENISPIVSAEAFKKLNEDCEVYFR